jgi:hypothetical protein
MSFGRALSAMAGAALFMLPAFPAPAAAAIFSLQTGGAAAPARHMVLLFFYRLQAFHDMAVQQDCLRAFPDQTRALNARYDALRRRVADLAGAASVEQRSEANRDDRGPGGDCGNGGLLLGYEDKLVTLERYLAGGVQ